MVDVVAFEEGGGGCVEEDTDSYCGESASSLTIREAVGVCEYEGETTQESEN